MIHTRREVVIITTSIRDSAREATEAAEAAEAADVTSTRERETSAANVIRRIVSTVASSDYYVGEQVVIINPSTEQENYGVAIGETRDRPLKIKPS